MKGARLAASNWAHLYNPDRKRRLVHSRHWSERREIKKPVLTRQSPASPGSLPELSRSASRRNGGLDSAIPTGKSGQGGSVIGIGRHGISTSLDLLDLDYDYFNELDCPGGLPTRCDHLRAVSLEASSFHRAALSVRATTFPALSPMTPIDPTETASFCYGLWCNRRSLVSPPYSISRIVFS